MSDHRQRPKAISRETTREPRREPQPLRSRYSAGDDRNISNALREAIEASGLRTLVDGQKVTFDVEPDRMGKGPKAVNRRAA